MERLTLDEAIKHAKEVAKQKYIEGMLCHANPDDGLLDGCIKCADEHEQLAKWLEELKVYKDLEEQGLLIKLPVKVGDTVFVVGTKCLANQEPDDEWCEKHDCDECVYDKEYIVFETKVYSHLLYLIMTGMDKNWKFGKTVFLTKAEAEASLERMGAE